MELLPILRGSIRRTACYGILGLFVLQLSTASAVAQTDSGQTSSAEMMKQLVDRLTAAEARIQQLESQMAAQHSLGSNPTGPSQPVQPEIVTAPKGALVSAPPNAASGVNASAPPPPQEVTPQPVPMPEPAPAQEESHDHMMSLPLGPVLHFRGFFDLNFDKGMAAQNLQYPNGTTPNSTFRTGEFDLFMTSQLSEKLSFLAELVFGEDQMNHFDADIERYILTYRPTKYFEISAGRYHTSIGYYNTAFHHGTWFSTATGRPFMYYWEDSGGVLPVHEFGISTTGLVPRSGKFNLHWTAEIGNGSSEFASPNYGDGVLGFASDRNRKDLNFAVYSKPEWLPGLQFGGSFLTGDLIPFSGVAPKVNQTISSVYAVFVNSKWEFMNEAVLLHHQIPGGRSYNSPLSYTQLSYSFGKYRPYFRFQENNIPSSDPVAQFTGRYEGPSLGLRMDFFDYAALKLQYNRIYLRDAATQNGFEAQLAFTF